MTDAKDELDSTEEMPEVEAELTELSIRYTGTSDGRTITQSDLSGVGGEIHDEHKLEDLTWTRGSVVPFAAWEEAAGSPERAKEMLQNQGHEFELVGPGAEDFWKEDDAEEDDGTEV